jgi:hypothetical protein
MHFSFGSRIRHPFFPGLTPIPAGEAKESSPALFGTFAELVDAASAGAHVDRAVFVTLQESEPLPSDSDRDVLWKMFQVPAFAMLLDRKGRVLAYECEAQSGLHVSPKYPMAQESAALCECGRPGCKLVQGEFLDAPVRQLADVERVRVAAID